MSLAQAASRVVSKYGKTYTLRRTVTAAGANSWSEGVETTTYHTCKARERYYKPQEIAGAVNEGDILLTIDATTLDVRPLRGDRISVGEFSDDVGADWATVVNVYEPAVADSFIVYKVQLRR